MLRYNYQKDPVVYWTYTPKYTLVALSLVQIVKNIRAISEPYVLQHNVFNRERGRVPWMLWAIRTFVVGMRNGMPRKGWYHLLASDWG